MNDLVDRLIAERRAAQGDLAVLAQYTEDPAEKAALEAMTGDDERAHTAYREQVYEPKRSVLDLLEACPSCRLVEDIWGG